MTRCFRSRALVDPGGRELPVESDESAKLMVIDSVGNRLVKINGDCSIFGKLRNDSI